MSDNHGYLLAIWCARWRSPAPTHARARVLARNARLLIGLAFRSRPSRSCSRPTTSTARFFRWAIAVDPRFEDSRPPARARRGRRSTRTRAWLDVAAGRAAADRRGVRRDARAARRRPPLLTWATILLEGAVALAFLAPRALALSRARDALLLIFCASTYAIAPVAGFGWLLLSMGVAQSEGERTRWLYLAVFALLVVHDEIRWLALVPGGG